ncbi:uncharacterized protein LOC125671627 [Ostrea edulis]|uniref:uncharacterized protein LOC125671627 n=1 Tax=Ostrea edulis TaxID=37623 RepID=UPI0024AFF525|nr:uncharacterized protein LOC125671627 [Ostrea edulis]
MYRRWVYMCLIFYLTLETSDSQCTDDKTCKCHCSCCSNCLGFYCSSCNREGWSGSTTNQCQRKNIAYNQTTTQISTVRDSSNAVDEDSSTYSRTQSEENPWIIVNFDKIERVKHMFITLSAGYGHNFIVYVTNSSNENLNQESFCAETWNYKKQRLKWNITCKNNQVITGDQVLLERKTNGGSLTVIDIKVFQCSAGTYGYWCNKMCVKCLDNQCDGFTGVCTKGCKSGWYGDRCGVECPSECESGSCDRYKGCTDCRDGYNGADCNKCTSGTYGKNCSLKCVNCDTYSCNNVNGCQQCWSGFYGPSCNKPCPEGCRNDECDKESGLCSVGCKDGYKGSDCQQPCDSRCATCDTNDACISCVDGSYGQQCELVCPETCGGKKSCDRINGQCHECVAGKYGGNCTESCSKNCVSAGICKRNGECLSGCINGWIGAKCDKNCLENCSQCVLSTSEIVCEKCDEGHYLDSDRKCQSCPSNCLSCDSESKCTRCKERFTGNLCESKCNVNCIDDLCEIDGRCLFGCSNRKHGIGCTTDCRENCVHCYNGNNCTRCLPGHYGIYCTRNCYRNCYNCTSGSYDCEACKPGFYGSYCENGCSSDCLTCDSADSCTSCRESWSGSSCQCNSKCADGCGNNGKCWNGCKGSFYGDYCDTPCPLDSCEKCDQTFGNCTECTKGRHGIHCDMDCSGTCLESACDIAGGCLRGCVEGFSGTNCAEQMEGMEENKGVPLYAYPLIGFLLVATVVVIVVLFVRRNLQKKHKVLSPYLDKEMKVTTLLTEDAPVYANNDIQHSDSPAFQKRSIYKENSPYNLRGSQAYLIELDPNDVDEIDLPVHAETDYYNIKITLVPIDQLWENVQEKKFRGEFDKEFETIPNGLLDSYKEALKPENRSRNRYKKMYPYDVSRVILQIENGTRNLDFINASFVNGFEKEKEYIAAQGPFTPETVYDFWRMIWQQNCGKIIMLTNLDENKVMKCKKYWPDTEDEYGHFNVKLEKEDISANYTIREFTLSAARQTPKGKAKIITQYHFTSWPDKGVPRNVTSIVEFRNKVISSAGKLNGPMLIHCSAGVGRTGTFMALDFLIKQGEREGSVDVINCVARMRQQRVHVVQTVEQYMFLHDAVIEGLTEGKSVVTAAEFPEYYSHLKRLNPSTQKSEIWEQFQLINKLSPEFDERHFKTAKLKENRCKNRYNNVLASDNYRIFISSGDSNYINAIQIPGHKNRNAFALTQMPLENTVQDFWYLVLEQDVSTIVMMNSYKRDKNVGIYWPEDREEATFGPIKVNLLEKETGHSPFHILKLKVSNIKTKEERVLKQFQCKFWSEDAVTPERPEPMLEMIKEVNTWQRQFNNPTIVVHCMNGAKKSGLFCTVATVIERLRTELEVGVLQTIVQMRTRRSQIVSSREQLIFCYDAVLAYLDMFNTYANLT